MNRTSSLIFLLIFFVLISEIFRERGISFLVTRYDSNFTEDISVYNELYFDENHSIIIKDKIFELGEEYYIKHKEIDLNQLLRRNQMNSIRALIENDEIQIYIKNKDKSLKKVNKEFAKIKKEGEIKEISNNGCKFSELKSKRENNYFYCYVDSYNSSIQGIPQKMFLEVCVDLISFWKKNNKELIYSIPKDEWMSINFQNRNELALTQLLDSCNDSISLIPDDFVLMYDQPITFQNVFYFNE